MRHLRMLGLMLLGALALGSYAAAMASAEEAGILPFLGAKEAEVKVESEAAANPAVQTAAGEYKCAKLDAFTGSAKGLHILLFNEVLLAFLECELVIGTNKIKCRSESLKGEKDPENTILELVDLHIVNLLKEKTTLEPGLVYIILDQNTKEVGTVKLKCGLKSIELKGEIKGLFLVSLVKDVTQAIVDFPTNEPCDTSDKLCLKYEELNEAKEPIEFLANFTGTFEKATQTAKVLLKSNVEVLFDD